jgi:hypothetical protein
MATKSKEEKSTHAVLKDISETLKEMALEQIQYHEWRYSGSKVVTDGFELKGKIDDCR